MTKNLWLTLSAGKEFAPDQREEPLTFLGAFKFGNADAFTPSAPAPESPAVIRPVSQAHRRAPAVFTARREPPATTFDKPARPSLDPPFAPVSAPREAPSEVDRPALARPIPAPTPLPKNTGESRLPPKTARPVIPQSIKKIPAEAEPAPSTLPPKTPRPNLSSPVKKIPAPEE